MDNEEYDSYDLLDIGANAYRRGNYEKALKYYKKSAELGNPQAACNLGYIYEYGRTGEKNPEKAFYYYSEAAMEDNVNAYYKIGDCYYYGDFVAKNPRLAFLNYQRAYEMAEDDDADIMSDIEYRLATCYYGGVGVDRDLLRALKYINDAQTYSYYDRINDKFMWQSTAKRIEKLRSKIIAELDKLPKVPSNIID